MTMRILLYLFPVLIYGMQFVYPDTHKQRVSPRPHNSSNFSPKDNSVNPGSLHSARYLLKVAEIGDLNNQILDSICTKTDSVRKYPSFYGGSFIEDGRLMFYIVGDSIEAMKQLKGFASDTILDFHKADYSYKYLLDLENKVSNELKNFPEKVRENVTGFNISVQCNRLIIYLREKNKKKIKEIRKVLNNPAIEFSQISDLIINEDKE